MAMRERPILFSSNMVKAILSGVKTQTRRVIKPQPFNDENSRLRWINAGVGTRTPEEIARYCPYGKPGDRLWVRETFSHYRGFGEEVKPDAPVLYRADGPDSCGQFPVVLRDLGIVRRVMVNAREPWKPSIHMPRWASRITLEVVSVRVERVQEISRQDAAAEGICYLADIGFKGEHDGLNIIQNHHWPEENFARLWGSINAKRGFGWDANPWVWVVEFKAVPA